MVHPQGWTPDDPSAGRPPTSPGAPWPPTAAPTAGTIPAPWASGPAPGGGQEPPRRGRWLPWLAAAAVVAAVAVGGYVLLGESSSDTPAGVPSDPVAASPPPAVGTGAPPAVKQADQPPGPGPAGPLRPVSVTATCQAPDSVDATGATIT
ncbi:hypothetical protein ACI8AC_17720 [Geodermatophilus sp. SYSU D00758]